ncbi:hypothetical protein QFZ94_008756 [Paraburkholderia sp. JPY465]
MAFGPAKLAYDRVFGVSLSVKRFENNKIRADLGVAAP